MLKGTIPELIDIPTGLGKTSVMAIWLAARGSGANLPRRLVYVVDRRAVVDQATEVALSLRKFVEHDATLKKTLGLRNDRSLSISTLRGQYVDNREWLDEPAVPAIIVGTVDMVGSRLLFEGYGVSRKMRPYHAGLLGVDTLVVLDEAHLVPPFEHLLQSIATDPALRPRQDRYRQVATPLRLLALSATGRRQSNSVFGLGEEDLKHDVVRKRLEAAKSLQIKTLNKGENLDEALAEAAWHLTDGGETAARVVVYSDSRKVAQKTKEAIEKLAKGRKKQGKPEVKAPVELLVGGRRVFEREVAKEWLEEHGFIAGSMVERITPVFLVATSAGEVGVDLDADHMVCDVVAWERMVQRLGRVNRRGDGHANIVVILEPEPEGADQLLAEREAQRKARGLEDAERIERLRAVRNLLERLPVRDDGGLDASPSALQDLKKRATSDPTLKELLNTATTPEPLHPALTRPLVEAWAMTSLEEHTGRPDIQPWLRGWTEEEPQTAVVWRKHLPVRTDGPKPSQKDIEAFFEATPPHLSEVLETETSRVLEWICASARRVKKQRDQGASTDAPCLHDSDVVSFILDADGRLRRSFTLDDLVGTEGENNKEKLKRHLAGATLIVDARLGGLKDGMLDASEATVPRAADDGHEWLGAGVVGFRVRDVEASGMVRPEGTWRERFRFPAAMTEEGEPTRWLIVEKWLQAAATEEDRSTANPQFLDEHQTRVEERARRIAQALGLGEELTEILAVAARFHDEGKRASRWQQAFHAPKDGIYAKTQGPIDYRLLNGYRHEFGSMVGIENHERIRKLSVEDQDLVLHLIAAHHGFARPIIGATGCEARPPSALEDKVAEIALRFERLQQRVGPWGLAWLETLLRAADQQASRENDAHTAIEEGR